MKNLIIIVMLLSGSGVIAQKSEVKKARKAFTSGEVESARLAIDKARVHLKTSKDWQVWMLRGDVYAQVLQMEVWSDQLGEDPGKVAYTSYNQALSLSGGKSDVLAEINQKLGLLKAQLLIGGMTQLTDGKSNRAFEYFQLGANIGDQIGEKAGEFHSMIANHHMQEARFAKAAEAYMKAVDDGYEIEQSMNNALASLSLAGSPQYEEVLVKYRSAYPYNVNLMVNEVNHRLGQGQYDKAEPILIELVQEEPYNNGYKYNLGMVQLTLDKDDGVEPLNEVLVADPFHLPSLELLSSHFLNKGVNTNLKLERVEESSEEAKQLLEQRNEFFDQFISYAERVIKLNPESKVHLTALSNVYGALGDDVNLKRIIRKLDLLEK